MRRLLRERSPQITEGRRAVSDAAGRKWRGISDQRHLRKVSDNCSGSRVIGSESPTIRDVKPEEAAGQHAVPPEVQDPALQIVPNPGADIDEPATDFASPMAVGFRDDDLGRLQRILVGDHVQQTNERLETLERALLGALGDLRESLDVRLGSIEDRLDAELETRTQSVANITEQLTEEARIRARAQNLLRRDMDEGFEKTTRLIDELEARVERSVEEARSDANANVASLESQSVSRSGLVQALVNAAEKLEDKRSS